MTASDLPAAVRALIESDAHDPVICFGKNGWEVTSKLNVTDSPIAATIGHLEHWTDEPIQSLTDEDCAAFAETLDKPYKLWDEGADKIILADSWGDAREQAQEWIDDCDWDTSDGTFWVRVHVAELDDNGNVTDMQDSVKVAIEPEEPPCIDDTGHDWQNPHEIVGGIEENPGVWGNGGGVIIKEVCLRCGCGKTTDTWAQDPNTGEQGLTSVKYEPEQYELKKSNA